MILIGITGKAGVGKDTAASFLVGNAGFKRYAFADPLKKIAAILFDTDPGAFDTQESKRVVDPRWGISRRHMAQIVGTEMVRHNLSKDHWIHLLSWRMDPRANAKNVITDVRFQNELDFILEHKGHIIHIESLSRTNHLSQSESNHPSEGGLDFSAAIRHNAYSHIQNDGTMKQFKSHVMDIYENLSTKQYGAK